MRVLVTGGNGFIGSHLVDALLARGDAVTVLDIAKRHDTHGALFVQGSVLERGVVAGCVSRSDLVVHLAAVLGVHRILEGPLSAMQVNVDGTAHVLEAAAREGVRTLIASTSEVYGKSAAQPLREDDDVVYGPTTAARWSYAYSKALDEFLALTRWRQERLPVTVLRFFNIVGPRQSPAYGMVLPRFVNDALHDAPLTVYGDGAQTRCFTDVTDCVDAILRLAACADAVGTIVNVGSQAEISMTALARLVIEVTHSRSTIVYVPYHAAYGPGYEDMRRRVPDLSRIERLVGWKATTPLAETIRALASARIGVGG